MNIRETIVAKWGAVAKFSKRVSKKIGKGIMCATLLTSVTGGIVAAKSIVGNTVQVFAAGANTYKLVDSNGNQVSNRVLEGDRLYYAKIQVNTSSNGFQYYYEMVESGEVIGLFSSPGDTFCDSKGDSFYVYSTNGYLANYASSLSDTDIDTSNAYSYEEVLRIFDIVKSGFSEQVMLTTQGTQCSTSSYVVSSTSNDSMAPALETQVFLTDVDSPVSLEYVLSQVKFFDEVDGNITVTMDNVTTDNYSANKNNVGKYTVVVSATDRAGNTGTGTIEIWVQDKTGPIITGQSTFISNMSSPLTEEYIRSQLNATDNVDSDVEITLVEDNFSNNEYAVGTKTIIYRATDSAGNVSIDYTITVNCVDDIKPTIAGESSYTTSYKNSIDINTIKNALTLNDNISSELTLELVSDNYTGNESIPGMYQIKYRTTDESGNISEVFTVTIEVNDKIPPVFYTSGLFIGISKANTLTHQEIVNLLLYMEGLAEEGNGVNVLSYGGYEVEATNAPGTYTLTYRTITSEGVESEVKEAKEDIENGDVVENDENDKWYVKTCRFVKENATYFYVGLGALVVGLAVALGFRKKDNYGKNRRRK